MKLKITIIIIVVLVCTACFYVNTEFRRIIADNKQLRYELAHATLPLQRDTIRDSIEVVTQTVVEVDRTELKRALDQERELVKELQLKVKQLEALQTTVIVTHDTVPAQYQEHDSIYYFNDQWADLSLNLKDTTFYYNIRDSLATVVYREYRHHFLWWKWGTKGYRLKIVNFNPHSRVIYNKYIKAGK